MPPRRVLMGATEAPDVIESELSEWTGAWEPHFEIEDALVGSELDAVSAAGGRIVRSRLAGVSLAGCRLRSLRLIDVVVSDADLSNADLGGASLTRVVFSRCRMTRLGAGPLGGGQVGRRGGQGH